MSFFHHRLSTEFHEYLHLATGSLAFGTPESSMHLLMAQRTPSILEKTSSKSQKLTKEEWKFTTIQFKKLAFYLIPKIINGYNYKKLIYSLQIKTKSR